VDAELPAPGPVGNGAALERRADHGIESGGHALTRLLYEEVTHERQVLDEMTVAVDDRMVDPGAHARYVV
jgi:hypothetical protein